VTIYMQHKSPGQDKEANWLPTPDGPFVLALRIYWPEQDILEGKWKPSSIKKVSHSN
jgi:hypothetical protein